MIQELPDSITGLAQGMSEGLSEGMNACLPLPFFLFAAFALGTVLGSACACLGERISKGESLLTRSRCPHCGNVLKAWHMLPLAGLALLKGRCAFCRAGIPLCSAFYEACMGILCAVLCAQAASLGLGTGFVLAQYAFLFFLCLAAETDRRTGYLPDRVLLLALPAALFMVWEESRLSAMMSAMTAMPGAFVNAFVNAFVCAALACLLFLLLRFLWLKLYRTEAIGLGDAKLVFILGLVTKELIFLAVAGASLLAMLATSHPKVRKAFLVRDLAAKGALPFGPFLAAGGIAVMIFCR